MAFTDEQKVIVTLLMDIHRKLEIDDGLDVDLVGEAVSGHDWVLSMQYDGLWGSPIPQDVLEVMEILEMWTVIERSYQVVQSRDAVTFQGFDGNNESQHAIARLLVGKIGRWPNFASRDLNSHAPSIEAYRRMLTVFNQLPEDVKRCARTMSEGELHRVIEELTHPDNR